MKTTLKIIFITLGLVCWFSFMAWAMLPGWQKPVLGTMLNRSHPLAQGLVGCWVMNEVSGGIINDCSGNGNTGTFNSVTWSVSEHGIGTFYGDRTEDYYISFTSDQLVNLPVTKNLSIVARFFSTSPGLSGEPLVTWGGTDDLLFYPNDGATGDGGLRVFWRDAGASQVDYAGPDLNGIWTQTIYTATVGRQVGYQDGILVATDTESLVNAGPFNSFRIGSWADSAQEYGGHVTYIYIYNRALTQTEVQSLYREPYQMFARPSVARRFAPGAAAADEPVKIAPKLMIMGMLKNLNPWADDYEDKKVINQ